MRFLALPTPTVYARAVRNVWIGVVLVVVTLGLYAQVGEHEFLNYDDPEYVTENPYVSPGLTRKGVTWAFTHVHQATWHPLTSLSHMLDCSLFGLVPAGHHLHNALLHAAGTLVLFLALSRMTAAPWASAFVAALFALHPLHVESVAWVSERKDVLSGLFWMLTLWAYAAYAEQPSRARYLLVLGTFALGLLAKPMLVTLPFVLLLLDYWPLARLSRAGAMRLVREKLPFFALAAVVSVVTYRVQVSAGAVSALEDHPLPLRLANALITYVAYVRDTIVPTGLAVFYPYPRAIPTWQVVGTLVFLLGTTAGVLRLGRRHPYLAVGWLWYLGTLVPVIGLIKQGDQAMADRFTYLPSIGLFLMLAWTALPLAARPGLRRTGLVCAALGTLAACAVLTWRQLGHWATSERLFTHTLAVTADNHLAHLNLGVALHASGDQVAARGHFARALALKPTHPKALVNVGMTLAEQGDRRGAIDHYRRAIAVSPGYASAHFNLGLALADEGRLDEAAAALAKALEAMPEHAKAHAQLGRVLAAQGRLDAAIAQYETALVLAPGLVAARGNLALALEQAGRPAESVAHYREILRQHPGDAMAHYNLGATLLGLGRADEALAAYRSALRARPEWPPAMDRVAWLLATGPSAAPQRAEAVGLAERACAQTRSEDPSLLRTLAAAYAAAERRPEAVAAAERGLSRARTLGQNALAAALANDLERYRSRPPALPSR